MKINDLYDTLLLAIEVEARNQRKYGPGGDEDRIGQIRSDLIADAILTALTAAGLRVVSAEPSDEDVERVARALGALFYSAYSDPKIWTEDLELFRTRDAMNSGGPTYNLFATARAAIRAFLSGGGDE